MLERKYVVKDVKSKIKIATISRPLIELSDKIDSYKCEVKVAEVDIAALVAMVCVIDEDHDEEDSRRRSE